MGKAVPKGIKSRANILIEHFADKFGKDFDLNKKFVMGMKLPFSKKERNVMAGFITRKMKQQAAAQAS